MDAGIVACETPTRSAYPSVTASGTSATSGIRPAIWFEQLSQRRLPAEERMLGESPCEPREPLTSPRREEKSLMCLIGFVHPSHVRPATATRQENDKQPIHKEQPFLPGMNARGSLACSL